MSQGYGKNKEETRFVRLHRRRGGLQLSSLLAGRLRRHNRPWRKNGYPPPQIRDSTKEGLNVPNKIRIPRQNKD